MYIRKKEKLIRDLTDDEITTLLSSALISQMWQWTQSGAKNCAVDEYYMSDLASETRNFLRKIIDYHHAPKGEMVLTIMKYIPRIQSN